MVYTANRIMFINKKSFSAGSHSHSLGRHDALLLPRVPHGLSRKGAPRAAPDRPQDRAALHLRHMRRRPQAKGAPGAPQARPQPRTTLRLFRVHQGLQEKRTLEPALRHTLGREDGDLQRVRKGILPEGPPAEAR